MLIVLQSETFEDDIAIIFERIVQPTLVQLRDDFEASQLDDADADGQSTENDNQEAREAFLLAYLQTASALIAIMPNNKLFDKLDAFVPSYLDFVV
jgi:hypothetical protein